MAVTLEAKEGIIEALLAYEGVETVAKSIAIAGAESAPASLRDAFAARRTGHRHESRVCATLMAALGLDENDLGDRAVIRAILDDDARVMRAVAALQADDAAAWSKRGGAFGLLGSGHRRGSDGPAYMAAASEALIRLSWLGNSQPRPADALWAWYRGNSPADHANNAHAGVTGAHEIAEFAISQAMDAWEAGDREVARQWTAVHNEVVEYFRAIPLGDAPPSAEEYQWCEECGEIPAHLNRHRQCLVCEEGLTRPVR